MKKEGSRTQLRYILQKENKLSNKLKGFSGAVDTIEEFGPLSCCIDYVNVHQVTKKGFSNILSIMIGFE